MHSFIETRHCRHNRRPRLDEVRRKRIRAFRKIDFRPDRDREHQPRRMFISVRERQKIEKYFVLKAENFQQPKGAIAIGKDIGVAHHHALGQAARPRGVDKAGKVVGTDLSDPGSDIASRFAPARHNLVEAQDIFRKQNYKDA